MFVFTFTFMLFIFNTNKLEVEAAKPTDSVYTYAKELKMWYPAASIYRDNKGFYFKYRNNGVFEIYLGKNSTMSFSSFVS